MVAGLAYYGDILETMVEGSNKAKCMRPKIIHVLLDRAPIVKSRGKQIPRFIKLPGCHDTVTYVEPEGERPVCRLCFQMGHTVYHCAHRKGAHTNEINQDEEAGVTQVNKKMFLRPKPKWWLPNKVTEIIDMKAIRQSMQERHAADWARIEELTNSGECKDHDNPLVPVVVQIDVEPPVSKHIIHPDAAEWQAANTRPNPKPPKKKPAATTPNPTKDTSTPPPKPTISEPHPKKTHKKKGNPIPIPGEAPGCTRTSPQPSSQHSKRNITHRPQLIKHLYQPKE
ncbi:hypothetical protein DSO57_1002275 [Entomophthora muscae]|uniref:Uncharacterized protein n=1 Tax=Entomophthora muscae TaxID=34485 RepID=A0ACC2TJD2_9FUNG|nr:hypothetical protein DSO57_1002275 [Entomophthora muscae]